MMNNIDYKNINTNTKKYLQSVQPFDIAEYIQNIDFEYQYKIMMLLPRIKQSKVFTEMIFDYQDDYYNHLDKNHKKYLLDNMQIDELKEFIKNYPIDIHDSILNLLKKEKSIIVKKLLIYEEDRSASMMTTEFIKLKSDMTITEATSHVFKDSKENDFINTLYLVENDSVLIGVIELKDLIAARKNDNLLKIANKDFNYINPHKPIYDAIDIIRDYDIESLPVLDYDNKILGVITADDILDEIILKKEREYKQLANVGNITFDDTILKRTIYRLPWLFIVVVINLITAHILLSFGHTIETISALVLFQPLVLGMSGNIATQSVAVTILKISDKYFDSSKKIKKHILSEFITSLIIAITIAIFGFLVSSLFLHLFPNNPTSYNNKPMMIGLVVGISLFIPMLISSLLGALVPIIVSKKGLNASNATGPLLSTLSDFIALIFYFLTATLILII